MSIAPRLVPQLRRRRLAVTLTTALATAACFASCIAQQHPAPTPVVLDTDVGNDIDDAFAIAMLLRMPAVHLVGVTTVSGDTAARARVAAKLLQAGGHAEIPVAAGAPSPSKPEPQLAWAAGFSSPAIRTGTATDLLQHLIEQGSGKTVLVAIGPLTNLASLLNQHPEAARQVARIILMGGSLRHGYYPGSGAIAESNIASDIPAAQRVFQSGIPITMVPLDATAAMQMDAPHLAVLFHNGTPLIASLEQLYQLWGQPVPTLHDAVAAAMLVSPAFCKTESLHITVTADGWTRISPTSPKSTVATACSTPAFLSFYERLFAQ